jgi:O-antigen ligase
MNQPSIVMRHGRLVRVGAPAAPATTASSAIGATAVGANDDAQAPKAITKALIVCFLLALWMPFSWTVASVRLTPMLIFLLIGFLPFTIIWLFKRPTPVTLPDYMILAFWLWSTVAVIINQGVGPSVQTAGVQLLQTVGAFAAGRVLVRNATSMRFMIGVVALSLMIATPFVIIESLTGVPVLLRLAHLVGPALAPVQMSPRMGLHRAQAMFEHPILLGVFSASILSLAALGLGQIQGRVFRLLGAAAAIIVSFFTLSTGALLSLNVQFGLMAWQRIFRDNPKRWRNLGILLAVLYIAVDTVSTRTPFHVFVQYATFSTGSSYNRILIWEFGSAEALRHPFFGIGFGEWQRPRYMSNSMDNFWLVQAVRYGIPAFLLLFGAVLAILFGMARRSGPNATTELMRRGVTFAIVATTIAIASVHLWNSTYIWLLFLLGSTVWMTLPVAPPSPVGTAPSPTLTSAERARRRLNALAAE